MDHMKILRRALGITWRYRVLWVFGILVALTTSHGGGGGNGGQVSFDESNLGAFRREFAIPEMPEIPSQVWMGLIAVGVGLLGLVIVLAIVGTVVRYVATTALIRMVDDYAATGEKHKLGQGIRWGWSRTAWRLFLIDLLIGLPVVVVLFILFVLAFVPLLLWTTGDQTAGIIGTLATIAAVIPLILLAIVVGVVLSLLNLFFRRTCALEGLGVIEAIKQGYSLVRQHLKDIGVMWLIMFGLGIAWLVVMIPVIILLAIIGVIAGGLPALLVGGLASLAFEGAWPWILAAVVGLPFFILAIAIPALFLGGLVEVYRSSVWTLTYRELRGQEALAPEPGPVPGIDAPGLEAAPLGS
jgi:hypothetical protein